MKSSIKKSAGFTLLELLVVIATITLLISILAPSLSAARQQAKDIVCGSQLAGLGRALATYTTDNEEWLPGLNTSSVALRRLTPNNSMLPESGIMNSSDLPVQAFDWMSPLLQQDTELPAQRAARFKLALERFKCPSMPVDLVSIPVGYNPTPDTNDFNRLRPWPATSYLMPVYFQYWGDNDAGKKLAPYHNLTNFWVKSESAPENYETVRVPSYISRLDRIGNPSEKLFVSDGTRYLDYDSGAGLTLDHDIAPYPKHFGAFGTSGGWWRGSTAFGVMKGKPNWDGVTNQWGSPSDGRNLQLSYRHRAKGRTNGTCQTNPGFINALFFDGHVEKLNDRSSRNIHMWYPKGAIVQEGHQDEGLTDVGENRTIR